MSKNEFFSFFVTSFALLANAITTQCANTEATEAVAARGLPQLCTGTRDEDGQDLSACLLRDITTKTLGAYDCLYSTAIHHQN
ncbi:uncharacterized protein V2V93DRAFT_371535 [Kockiozyma suomiensis]|uniref:uncharacterized protein n=1 Tax=Kockiozyma suomiensis TaxID=1337062 RepID=UPI00334348B4